MGITGLLPFLEKSSMKCNISRFSGGTVAIDSYCWLHKGAFSCADKLVMGQPTDAYVKYCMKFVQMLLDAKIKPILVFDGRHLQAKAETEVKRRENRKINRKKGAELMRMGNTAEGRNLLRRSLDISHKMALELIKECQQQNIDCIVAPYEADAQLAYLNISGIADVVITEDSDLTLFGCKKIFFKMDLTGNGVLVEQERIHVSMGVSPENFSMEKFRHMCILSGCDYLASLPGIGLMKACKFMLKISDCDIQKALPRMSAYLNMKSLTVTKEYIDNFLKADVTFKHQLVFCPLQRKQVRLFPPTDDVTEEQLKFAGEEMQDENLAWQVALGNYDPFTFEELHNFDPDNIKNLKRKSNSWAQKSNLSHVSIWSRSFDVNGRKIVEREKKFIKMPVSTGKVSVMPNFSQKRSYDEVDELSDSALIKMYMTDIENDKKKSESQSSGFVEAESNESNSPDLRKGRVNPFRKQIDESPSYLSKGRKRSMLRFKPTVIDNSAVQSKFFANGNGEENKEKKNEHLIKENENLIEENENMVVDDSAEKIETNQSDSVIEASCAESINFIKLHDQVLNESQENAMNTSSDTEEYFSPEPIKSNLFQFNNPKSNHKTRTNSSQKTRPLTRQSSGKKLGAKKIEPIAGQSLLNQFGFHTRTVSKR